ncbi:hypothetical protein ACFFIY_13850 [Bhargavaea ullalensis]|uniref:HEPN domain-containing protein n=1 Tax=Bhargavaea ullalensis TaxID=1265685 RepID=A0ABV2GEM7_9BACL|nr:hypothetical protein [Bhargavaea cecembensis]
MTTPEQTAIELTMKAMDNDYIMKKYPGDYEDREMAAVYYTDLNARLAMEFHRVVLAYLKGEKVPDRPPYPHSLSHKIRHFDEWEDGY